MSTCRSACPGSESREYFYEILDVLRLADSQERFSYDGEIFKVTPTTVRPQPRHKGHLLDNVRAAFTTKKSAELAAEAGLGQMFVAGEPLDAMSQQVAQFNTIRAAQGLPPDQPTALLWMYCAETEAEIEEGYGYFESQLLDAKNHYFDWNSTGFEGVPGYEEYAAKSSNNVDFGAANVWEQRKTQPIGTPDQVIAKIKEIQEAVSLGYLVVHTFYGAMPVDKAEKSLRLFANEVLPAIHEMGTPLHEHSLGVTAGAGASDPMSVPPSRALVLAGGGVTGIAWELGFLSALHDAGADVVASADLVLGTSAGAAVGAQVTAGVPLRAARGPATGPGDPVQGDQPSPWTSRRSVRSWPTWSPEPPIRPTPGPGSAGWPWKPRRCPRAYAGRSSRPGSLARVAGSPAAAHRGRRRDRRVADLRQGLDHRPGRRHRSQLRRARVWPPVSANGHATWTAGSGPSPMLTAAVGHDRVLIVVPLVLMDEQRALLADEIAQLAPGPSWWPRPTRPRPGHRAEPAWTRQPGGGGPGRAPPGHRVGRDRSPVLELSGGPSPLAGLRALVAGGVAASAWPRPSSWRPTGWRSPSPGATRPDWPRPTPRWPPRATPSGRWPATRWCRLIWPTPCPSPAAAGGWTSPSHCPVGPARPAR